MNELIPVIVTEIAGRLRQAVNLRELHGRLEVGRDFSNWVKDRISKYGFTEKQDYVIIEGLVSPNLATSKSRARTTIEYHATVGMAKELAMVENNEIGRSIRRYLIDFEERSRRPLPPDFNEEWPRVVGMVKTCVHKITEHEHVIEHLKAASELGMERLIELSMQVKALGAPAPDLMLARDYVPAFEVVAEMAKVPEGKRYPALCTWVSKHLRVFCGDRNLKKLPTYPGTKDAFPRDAAHEWLEKGGRELIWIRVNEHQAGKSGQNVLPFPSNSPTKPGA